MQCVCTHSFKSLPTYHPPWHLHDLRFRVYSKLYGSECSRLNNRGKMNWPILLLLVWGTHYNFFVIIAWQATAYVNNMNALFNDIFACFSIYSDMYIIFHFFVSEVLVLMFKDWAMNDKEEVVIFRQKSSSTFGEKTSGSKDVMYCVSNQIMGFYMVIAPYSLQIYPSMSKYNNKLMYLIQKILKDILVKLLLHSNFHEHMLHIHYHKYRGCCIV